ncbi:uncharacterized protein adm2b [Silurus meridionalis]|uniref:uncharacterized protein adm2b n=1 Tax=Silurus meridionalis TaxID=175797 RepID=UPI001EEA8B70|nr:uncharacterized protein adm2b [Silurus meridionalis]
MKTPTLRCARSVFLLILILHVVKSAPARNRSTFPRKSWTAEGEGGITMVTNFRPLAEVKDLVWKRRLVWRDLEHKDILLSNSPTQLSQTLIRGRQKRGLRQLHGQLMRVGCILGTCQVQNLSFRLYQLIGQRKRDRSPSINPKSPHSYG